MTTFRSTPTLLMGALAVALALAAVTRAQQDRFPSPVGDWQRQGEIRSFTAENLWEYINGDADRYVEAGVEQTYAAEYRWQNALDASVDIHVMKTAVGAERIFATETQATSDAATVGEAARISGNMLIFRKGRHFVRIVAFEERPGLKDALLSLGRAIAERME
ncbi:MAG: hypothetical protein MUF51_04395 [Vicinamibacteria bacterium]|nr:hypothetical protein [Vicinamibacteria bacterium]